MIKNKKICFIITTLLYASVLTSCGTAKDTVSSDASVPSVKINAESAASESESEESGEGNTESGVEGIDEDYTDSTISVVRDDTIVTDTDMTKDNIADFLQLTDYKGLQIEVNDDAEAEDGMIVNIDYTGTIDGKEFDGGSASGYNLELGSDSFIDGFEDQIIGHKKGDSFDVNVTFPEYYGVEDLNGRDAVFAVKINNIYRNTPDNAVYTYLDDCEVKQVSKTLMDSWIQDEIDNYNAHNAASDDSSASSTESVAMAETLADVADAYGTTESDLYNEIMNTVKRETILKAILLSEDIKEDSDAWKTAEEETADEHGVESIEDLTQYGFTKTLIHMSIEQNAVKNVFIKYEA